MGPLIFLIYVNDITDIVQSRIRLFADDTALYIKVDKLVENATALKQDLVSISDWLKLYKYINERVQIEKRPYFVNQYVSPWLYVQNITFRTKIHKIFIKLNHYKDINVYKLKSYHVTKS